MTLEEIGLVVELVSYLNGGMVGDDLKTVEGAKTDRDVFDQGVRDETAVRASDLIGWRQEHQTRNGMLANVVRSGVEALLRYADERRAALRTCRGFPRVPGRHGADQIGTSCQRVAPLLENFPEMVDLLFGIEDFDKQLQRIRIGAFRPDQQDPRIFKNFGVFFRAL
ncbi:hypothetical protein D3C87_1573080 [compost metagenome]